SICPTSVYPDKYKAACKVFVSSPLAPYFIAAIDCFVLVPHIPSTFKFLSNCLFNSDCNFLVRRFQVFFPALPSDFAPTHFCIFLTLFVCPLPLFAFFVLFLYFICQCSFLLYHPIFHRPSVVFFSLDLNDHCRFLIFLVFSHFLMGHI